MSFLATQGTGGILSVVPKCQLLCNVFFEVTIILPVKTTGNGCETWSLILREERKLRVFENMVLR